MLSPFDFFLLTLADEGELCGYKDARPMPADYWRCPVHWNATLRSRVSSAWDTGAADDYAKICLPMWCPTWHGATRADRLTPSTNIVRCRSCPRHEDCQRCVFQWETGSGNDDRTTGSQSADDVPHTNLWFLNTSNETRPAGWLCAYHSQLKAKTHETAEQLSFHTWNESS
jgi:hypothetical protein